MIYITSIEEVGIEKGRTQGRMEGRVAGLREGIVGMLDLKFGEAAASLIAEICRRQIDSGQVAMVCYHGQL